MFDEHRETSRKKIINMVEDARERGEISSQVDSEAFTTIFAGAVRVSVLEWRASGFEYSLTDEAEKLSEELGRGL